MKVRDLLTDESKWTKGVFASTANGRRAAFCESDAVRFCLLGAITRCYPYTERHVAIDRVASQLSGRGIAEWNDDKNTTFADVRSLVEKLDI